MYFVITLMCGLCLEFLFLLFLVCLPRSPVFQQFTGQSMIWAEVVLKYFKSIRLLSSETWFVCGLESIFKVQPFLKFSLGFSQVSQSAKNVWRAYLILLRISHFQNFLVRFWASPLFFTNWDHNLCISQLRVFIGCFYQVCHY